MIGILIWVICGVFAAVVANSKGFNVGLWLLLGFLFGIFALIAVAAIPAEKKAD